MGGMSLGYKPWIGVNSKAMFELSASMQWTRLEQTLKIGHLGPLAIPIPDELVHESPQPNIIPNKRRRIVKHVK